MNDETIEKTVRDDVDTNPTPVLSETEMLDWYTHRIQTVVQEQIEEGFRPMTDKALVLGVLLGAKALCRIAAVLEFWEPVSDNLEP